MRNLKEQLQDYLKGYMVDAEHFDIEDFRVNYPTALDIELTQTLLIREELERHRGLLSLDEKELLNKADKKFLQLWEEIKTFKTENPHVKLAIAVLSELVKVIGVNKKQPVKIA